MCQNAARAVVVQNPAASRSRWSTIRSPRGDGTGMAVPARLENLVRVATRPIDGVHTGTGLLERLSN